MLSKPNEECWMTSIHGRQVPDPSRRRVASLVAKVEFHPDELFPRVGFIATNRSLPNEQVLAFYNDPGEGRTAHQGSYVRAQRPTRGIVRENKLVKTWKITFSACSLARGWPFGECRLEEIK